MFLFFLLGILGTSVVANPLQVADVSATCTAAQANVTNQCLVQYFANFGPIVPFTFDNFNTIANDFVKRNGLLGYEMVCQWYNSIGPCIAPSGANLSTCLTDDNFVNWFDTSHTDSILFRTSLLQAQYQCNTGYQVAVDNFNCLFNISDAQERAVMNCLTTYNDSISMPDPDYCKAYNTYILCTEDLYNTYCGPQVQAWLCNTEEVGMEVNDRACDSVLPQCGAAYKNASSCTIQQAGATKQCFQTYYNNFANVSPFTYYNFEIDFQNYLTKTGSSGLQNVCSWQNAIAPCASAAGANLSACLNNDNFAVWFQTNLTDSIAFRTFYYESVYECNDGLKVATDNFQCLFQPIPSQQYALNNCLNHYNSRIANQSDTCKAFNDYMICTENTYKNNPMCGNAVQPWLCKVEEIGMQVNHQGCKSVLQDCSSLNAVHYIVDSNIRLLLLVLIVLYLV